jgi:hypothetical protein
MAPCHTDKQVLLRRCGNHGDEGGARIGLPQYMVYLVLRFAVAIVHSGVSQQGLIYLDS